MSFPRAELQKKCDAFGATWAAYCATPRFEQFVEFAVILSSFAEFLNSRGLSGLHQLSRDLEQQALVLFGDDASHPITAGAMQELTSRVEGLGARVASYIENISRPIEERRAHEASPIATDLGPSRRIWFATERPEPWRELIAQLGYFGIDVVVHRWEAVPSEGQEPTCLLLDIASLPAGEWAAQICGLRERFAASNLVGLSVAAHFDGLQSALAAGCNVCFGEGTPFTAIVAKILELSDSEEETPYRVLIVEDSLTASKLIQRTMEENGVESLAISHPRAVLDSLNRYQPDLILMDMYMPGCTGVEAARVIRQHAEFLSVPIVYLSGETDVALQVEALRLGGDHFLTKPFNPVILNAVVQSKIERYRALRRTMFQDSLTGLYNHTSTKQRLDTAVLRAANDQTPLSVAMIDIDHFKRVNDTYGHPAGDQVIRSLAWLLKRRLRNSDIIGRYGGEEFLVGLPLASSEQALQVLDRIRCDFGQIKHPFNETWFNTTFSAGIAGNSALTTGEDLVKLADEALYVAKRGGRNRVFIHS